MYAGSEVSIGIGTAISSPTPDQRSPSAHLDCESECDGTGGSGDTPVATIKGPALPDTLVWTSSEEKLRERFRFASRTANKTGLVRSPFFPRTAGELAGCLAESREQKIAQLKAIIQEKERALAKKRVQEETEDHHFDKDCSKLFKMPRRSSMPSLTLMGGRIFTDNLSAVLALSPGSPFNPDAAAAASAGP